MFKCGAKVEWKWLGRKIRGVVREVHTTKLVRTIKGKRIVRIGTKENPAYVVESDAGNLALKLESELSRGRASKARGAKSLPSMFSN